MKTSLVKVLALASFLAVPFSGHAQILPGNLGPAVSASASHLSVLASSTSGATTPLTVSRAQASLSPSVSAAASPTGPVLAGTVSPASAIQTPALPVSSSGTIHVVASPASSLIGNQVAVSVSHTVIPGSGALAARAASGSIAQYPVSGSSTGGSSSGSSGTTSGGYVYVPGGTTTFNGYASVPATTSSGTQASQAERYAYARSGVVHDSQAQVSQKIELPDTDTVSPDTQDQATRPVSGQASVAGIGLVPTTLVGWLLVLLAGLAIAVGVREYRISRRTQASVLKADEPELSEAGYVAYMPRPVTA